MAPNLKSLKEFESNQHWLQAHYQEVLEEHKDQFVAVWRNSVIDSDSDLDALSDRVHKRVSGAKGVYIEFVTDQPLEMIL